MKLTKLTKDIPHHLKQCNDKSTSKITLNKATVASALKEKNLILLFKMRNHLKIQ